jgi:uncharacterized protein
MTATAAASRASRRPEHVSLTVRRVKFDYEEGGFERYWHRGSPFTTNFYVALSSIFPAGEAFFIESVRHYKDRIEDPELRVEVDTFCRQEGHHAHHHSLFDRINREHGFDVDACHGTIERLFQWVRRNYGPEHKLALTVAFEHMTANASNYLLADPSLMKGANPKVAALWYWHCAEEVEHKSTAFDVFQAIGGSYWTRMAQWGVAVVLFPAALLGMLAYLLWKDRKALTARDTVHGLGFLFGYPRGFFTNMVPAGFSYLSPRFHPWDEDNSHLLRQLDELPVEGLAGRAAERG